MIYLSNSALWYAISICGEKQRYKVIVATNSRADWSHIEAFLLSYTDTNSINRVVSTKNEFFVEFKNGSIIRLISANPSVRGFRAHLLVADPAIDKNIMKCVLLPIETLERSMAGEQQNY